MPTLQEQPGDIQWVVVAASGTSYVGWNAALVAATTLSAGNSNGQVYIAQVMWSANSKGSTGGPQVDLPGNARPLYVIGLVTGATTYIPEYAALNAAFALSTTDSNVAIYGAKTVNLVTAP